jgi:hypothetical protein
MRSAWKHEDSFDHFLLSRDVCPIAIATKRRIASARPDVAPTRRWLESHQDASAHQPVALCRSAQGHVFFHLPNKGKGNAMCKLTVKALFIGAETLVLRGFVSASFDDSGGLSALGGCRLCD